MNEHEQDERTPEAMAYGRETEREAKRWARERAEARRGREFRRGVRAYRVLRLLGQRGAL